MTKDLTHDDLYLAAATAAINATASLTPTGAVVPVVPWVDLPKNEQDKVVEAVKAVLGHPNKLGLDEPVNVGHIGLFMTIIREVAGALGFVHSVQAPQVPVADPSVPEAPPEAQAALADAVTSNTAPSGGQPAAPEPEPQAAPPAADALTEPPASPPTAPVQANDTGTN